MLRKTIRISTVVLVLTLVSCSAPGGPAVQINETSWTASPSAVQARGGEFTLTVTNKTAQDKTFAVIFLFEGEPESMPTVDGLLDLDQRNWVPGETNFSIVYPEYETQEGEGVAPAPLDPAEVEADAESTFTIGGFKGGGEPGTYVVLSWSPGGYEAGDYASFEITG